MAPLTVERVEAPVTVKAYLMCAFAAFAGILFGFDSGYISGVLGMDEFKKDYGHPVSTEIDASGYLYSTSNKSLIVSILSAGTFFGAILSGALADWFGRRTTIIAGCVVFAIGVIVQIAHASIPTIVVGRLIAGFGVGFVSAINILYMSEVAPRKVRGAIVSCYQFAITIGLMLASCVGYATQHRTDSSAYRIPIGLQFAWALILGTGLALLPESPRYFIKKGQLDQAAKALARVRGQPVQSDYIQDELAEIQANFEYEQQVGEVGWLGLFTGGFKRNSNFRKVFIGTMLQMMQQWTGVNFIFYYNTTFFQGVGLKNPFLISMITTIVNVCSTPISFYTIERFGRRPLLIWGAVGMCICEYIVAIVGTAAEGSTAANLCLIVFVCLYVFFFASTWGPAAWVCIGEIFQLPIRSKGVALSTASNWFWNCIIGLITPYMVDKDQGNLGSKVFFVWGTTCGICILFAYFFVPETKGLTLEQVDKMMEEVPARKSAGWRPHDTFSNEIGLKDEATIETVHAETKM
ncbi:general substrate transporter [Polychaeton citri CBS 116435]|uniref:General substrate transporter n=1 Tax=Polychaeton citri CBS 116435 TaxID=1314669 RepID=A0A9P4QF09_9PEZI|nr:general substrate transporter [Polychaeton citri CBS 116435]